MLGAGRRRIVAAGGAGASEAVGMRMGGSPLLLVERIRYEVVLPNGKWAAIVAILALQAYLVLAPNGEAPYGSWPARPQR
jgi:hypothetical protein